MTELCAAVLRGALRSTNVLNCLQVGAIFIVGVLEGRKGFNGLRIMTTIGFWLLSWPLLVSISVGLMAFCTRTPFIARCQ